MPTDKPIDENRPRPFAYEKHPVVLRTYRVATPAIEHFYQLVERCLRYAIPGALVYGRPRIGKTYAIEYLRLLLARSAEKVPTFHVHSQHKVSNSEGAFFANLLRSVGYPEPDAGRNFRKRTHLTQRILEVAKLRDSSRVVFFCDEAQRYNRNGYEWLRDVHDELAQHSLRLTTFLVGQPNLLAQKIAFQKSGDDHIVARFMIDELHFHGVMSAEQAAACLSGFDVTQYPENSGWTFTRFFFPKAFDAGMRLAKDAHLLWNAFAEIHHESKLTTPLDIPMEYFSRAVEIAIKESFGRDSPDFRINPDSWRYAVSRSGYVVAQQATPAMDGAP